MLPRTKRAKPAFHWPDRSLRLWTSRHPLTHATPDFAADQFAREYFHPFPREAGPVAFRWGPDARAVSTPIGSGEFTLADGTRRYLLLADSLGWWSVYVAD